MSWVDSMFNSNSDETQIRIIGKNPDVYCAASFRTLDYSFDTVAGVILDYPRYAKIFNYMNKFEMLKNGRKYSDFGSAYFEVGVFFAFFWTIGKIDSVIYKQDDFLRVKVTQIYDKAENESIRKIRSGGFIVVTIKNYGFRWYCVSKDKKNTRVGFVTWLTPDSWLPGWVYHWGGRIIVPRMLRDLETEIKNNHYIVNTRKFEN
jgi:hypothetical protein